MYFMMYLRVSLVPMRTLLIIVGQQPSSGIHRCPMCGKSDTYLTRVQKSDR